MIQLVVDISYLYNRICIAWHYCAFWHDWRDDPCEWNWRRSSQSGSETFSRADAWGCVYWVCSRWWRVSRSPRMCTWRTWTPRTFSDARPRRAAASWTRPRTWGRTRRTPCPTRSGDSWLYDCSSTFYTSRTCCNSRSDIFIEIQNKLFYNKFII